MNNRIFKNGILTLLLVVMGVALLYAYRAQSPATKQVSLTEAIQKIDQGQVKAITLSGNTKATLETNDGSRYDVALTGDDTFSKAVLDYNSSHPQSQVNMTVQQESPTLGLIGSVLLSLLPVLLIGGFFIYMMRQAQGTNNQALSFGKSRARMFIGNKPTVTFDDVAGVDEAKQELQEVVEFLKYPEKFSTVGARIPRGVLLVGPPGTGKTLLARAVAGEAGVPFFSISGSEFVEMFVGVGASRVRDLFDQAKRNAPCIVFIDEIDAVGRQRGAGLGGSHDEREQTLNQILVEMDGFDTGTNVIVLASTNRPDVLDPALLRPGRFDRQVVLDRPDIRGRKAILDVHVRGKPLDKTVELLKIAKISPGFSGADLANVVNEAAILAARRNKKTIGQSEFEEALEKVALGPERRSRVITEKEKMIVAYHESGHALCFKLLKHTNPVHKITIVSRGMAMGVTWSLPQEDRYFRTKREFEDDIAAALGGWVAEQIHLGGDMTTGASNDIEKASEMARQMVTKYGMSEKLGPLQYGRTDELIFLGRQIQEERNYSEDVAKLIDSEVKEIIDAARERAYQVLTQHKDKLDAVVRRLITDETMSSDEFDKIFEDQSADIPAAASVGQPSEPPTGQTGGDDRRPGTGKGPAPAPSPA
ncbi:MAG: ATP-dependent zinc metalloprotease FtsH [Chloroflexota bacterium]|nr:ATP-dependent zinc metalloprotease FtsH [Chloroflexota bacterium]MDE3194239.1 ATP-dependent zinc metalloprotease FtsH [Chloroflexota bacterium]